MWSNREKSNIAITLLEKLPLLKGNKNYFTFWLLQTCNNIFADCIYTTDFLIKMFWLWAAMIDICEWEGADNNKKKYTCHWNNI